MADDHHTELFYRHIWPLRATVLRTATFLTRSVADAEDLAQETMLKAFRAMGRFDPESNPQAWVMTILRNTRIDKLRAARAHPTPVSLGESELDVPEAPGDVAEPRTEAELRQIGHLIEGFSDAAMIVALKALPEEICWTLLLADVEGLDYTQAAEILGVPVGTVKSRVHRGRQMLRESLLQDDGRPKGARR